MWHAWDFAADLCLAQLPRLQQQPSSFRPSTFFQEQLTAFEVWLDFGAEKRTQPEQLPIVLQVLLSQTHRLRALQLLGRFLDMGSWATVHALSVGIFPYVLRLLQSPASDLRYILVFIWTKLLVFDPSCQLDLVKDQGQHYFLRVLSAPDPFPVDSDKLDRPCGRVIACFVLATLCRGHRPGQAATHAGGLLHACLELLADVRADQSPMLQQWLCLCVSECCDNFDAARVEALCDFVPGIAQGHSPGEARAETSLPIALRRLLSAPSVEVRRSAIHAMGRLFGGKGLVATWNHSAQPSSPIQSDTIKHASPSIKLDANRKVKLGQCTDGTVVLARRHQSVAPDVGTSVTLAGYTMILPGTRLKSVDGQVVDGLSLQAVLERIESAAAAPVLSFESGQDEQVWDKKELALAYFLIHSMSDANPTARVELCNALARFVEHHRASFLRHVAPDAHGDDEVSVWASTFADVRSCVRTLRHDAVPAVASRAAMVDTYISILRPTVTSTASNAAGEIMISPVDDKPVQQKDGLDARPQAPAPNVDMAVLDAHKSKQARLDSLTGQRGVDIQTLPAFLSRMASERRQQLLTAMAAAKDDQALDRIKVHYQLSDDMIAFLTNFCGIGNSSERRAPISSSEDVRPQVQRADLIRTGLSQGSVCAQMIISACCDLSMLLKLTDCPAIIACSWWVAGLAGEVQLNFVRRERVTFCSAVA